jgi:hypothetical protein
MDDPALPAIIQEPAPGFVWMPVSDQKRKEHFMRTLLYSGLLISAIGLAASGCTTAEQRTAGYGVGGAAIGGLAGAAIGGNTRGALTGAAIGAAAGTLIGVAQTRNGVQYCRYRDRNGRIFEAACR